MLESEEESVAFTSLAAADSALSRLADCELCPLSRLRSTEEYQLILRIAVRPLAPEDREHLSGYVGRTGADDNEGTALDLSGLFGRALEETGSTRRVIGQASPFFRAGDLREAP